MDGVLLDSEEYITRAGILMFREKGYQTSPSDFKDFTGMGENRFLGGVAEKYHIPFDVEKDKKRTYEIYREISKGKLQPLHGVVEFIKKCRSENLKLAVATSADEVKMRINLEETGLSAELFDCLVYGELVRNKKPDPEIYLLAASLLGVKAEECLVAEDALSGMEAAAAAGCRCLAITTSFPKEQFTKAQWFAKDLDAAPEDCIKW